MNDFEGVPTQFVGAPTRTVPRTMRRRGFSEWLFSPKCSRCKEMRTKANDGLCEDCHAIVEAETKEGQRLCLTCQSPMRKKLYEGVVIDKCPKDGAVWLDGKEIEKIAEQIDNDSSSGFGSGLVVGMAIN